MSHFPNGRALALGAVLASFAVSSSAAGPAPPPKKEAHELPRVVKEVGGDFDALKKRRLIRVLVVYNKTNYFIDKGTPHGATYEAFKLFEDDLNKKYKTGNLKIHVACIPMGRAQLAEALLSGRGDIAAANLTITPERQKIVDFSTPTISN